MSLAPGVRLGPYQVVSRLGAGGMGEVFLARDTRLGRDIALKALPDAFARDDERRARLNREARLLASLNHPNVASLFGIEESDGGPILVMELVPGPTLAERLLGKPLPVREALDTARQVAEGLEAAHRQGIIHRDLKPGNVKLTSDGRVKVLDFGLARILVAPAADDQLQTATASRGRTDTGAVIGTAAYMSPEQARGEPLDERTDVWSFGCLLYECLTAQKVFSGPTAADTLAAVLEHEPNWAILPSATPSSVKTLLGLCLRKDRAGRLQRISDARLQIEQALAADQQAEASARSALFGSPWRWAPLMVAGVLGLALAAGIPFWPGNRPSGRAATPKVGSLAVLPLANLMGDSEQEYLVAGMHEALIAELGQIGALGVISRTSVARYRNTDRTLPEIARELNVDALVEGSMLRAGDSVRIQVHLIGTAPAERRLWSGTYDGDLRNVLALQKRVAREIAEQIRVLVTPQEAARLASARPVDPAAYDAWAKGWFQFTRMTGDSLGKCLDHAGAALAIDPTYAPAHALTAACYSLQPNVTPVPAGEAFPKAEAAARRALELDEQLADAHFPLAWTLAVYQWDWAGAEREFRRGLELNPGSAFGHARFGWVLSWLGREDEALAEVRRAVQLSPLGLYELQATAAVHYVARRYDDAIVAARRATEIDPNYAFGYLRLGNAYAAKGMHEQAISALEAAVKLSGGALAHKGALGRSYALSGRRQEARRALDDLIHSQPRGSPFEIAKIHVAFTEKEEAIRWLEEGCRLRDGNMILLKVWPEWDLLHTDARFQRLLRRMSFP